MEKIIILILCWLILMGLGCNNESARMETENPEKEFPVIVHLEKRNEVVTIMSGQEELLYTVRTKDGRTLAQDLSEQELQTKLPDIYNSLKKSYAGCNKSDLFWGGH
jgi:hypothetical protein